MIARVCSNVRTESVSSSPTTCNAAQCTSARSLRSARCLPISATIGPGSPCEDPTWARSASTVTSQQSVSTGRSGKHLSVRIRGWIFLSVPARRTPIVDSAARVVMGASTARPTSPASVTALPTGKSERGGSRRGSGSRNRILRLPSIQPSTRRRGASPAIRPRYGRQAPRFRTPDASWPCAWAASFATRSIIRPFSSFRDPGRI